LASNASAKLFSDLLYLSDEIVRNRPSKRRDRIDGHGFRLWASQWLRLTNIAKWSLPSEGRGRRFEFCRVRHFPRFSAIARNPSHISVHRFSLSNISIQRCRCRARIRFAIDAASNVVASANLPLERRPKHRSSSVHYRLEAPAHAGNQEWLARAVCGPPTLERLMAKNRPSWITRVGGRLTHSEQHPKPAHDQN
jgi:hypothetical protein